MKRLALLILAVQLLALAPAARADAPTPTAQLDDLAQAWLAGLDRQGDLPVEMSAMAAPRPGPALPPALDYQDAHPACDLDGDGINDLIVNTLTLSSPPNPNNAPSQVRAVSGADGHELWKANNLRYVEARQAGDINLQRVGRSQPAGGPNVAAFGDANGDGVCDAFAYGYRSFTSINFVAASISSFETQVKVLDGKTGKALWTMTLPGEVTAANAPTAGESRINGTPTGFLPFLAPDGPKVLVKTSDVEYTSWAAPLGLPPLPILPTPIFEGAPQYRSARVDEHIALVDGKTGKTDWTRDILQAGDAKFTNVTFFSGVGDLVGDAKPDVVLDQLVLTNPRSNEMKHPIDGSTLYRYGRGARAMALNGATGEIAWTSLVRDPLPVEANPPAEENKESVVWTRATVLPDLDGDGKPDVVASYLASEESLGRTLPGAIRTHFVALHGANGTPMWDVRQQGWGTVRPDGGRFLAFGTLDVPQATAPGQRFPPKSVRMGVLDGADGATVWSYERQFAQNSFLSYNLGLAQFETALTAGDADKDGRLDLLTPAQYAPATGSDQVLLSTSTHSYQLMSGLDGAVLQTYDVWGPQGRVVDCGDPGNLTVVSGHGRRVDLTRLDLATGARVWRKPVYNDAAPHAATTAVDVETLGAACANGADGRTLAAVNLQLVSGQRGREVVPLLAGLDTRTGETKFLSRPLQGDPSTSEALLRASVAAIRGDAPKASLAPPLVAGAALGIGAAVAAVALLRKGVTRAGRLLAVALGLILIASPVSALAVPAHADAPAAAVDGVLHSGAEATAPPPAPAAPSVPSSERAAPAPLPASPLGRLIAGERALGAAWTPAGHVDLVGEYLRASGAAKVPEAFDANASLFYTYPTSDLDGDNVPDVIVDDFCVDFNACGNFARLPDDAVNYLSRTNCEETHHAYAFSSRTKTVLWDLDVSPDVPWGNCAAGYVIGAPILPDGTPGLLVYKYVTYGHWAQSAANPIDNTLVMLDARTGKEIWHFTEMGTYSSDLLVEEVAKSVFLNPVLATDAKGASTLLVQGVGYQTTGADTVLGVDPFGLIGILPAADLVDSYTPLEWAASIDLADGHIVWRADTFTDVKPYSVFPRLHDGEDYIRFSHTQTITDEKYWGGAPPLPNALPKPRAFDVTGDGVPDLIYHVTEWARTPWSKAAPPFFYDVRMVVVDGKTGKVAIDKYVERDLQVSTSRQAHGDSYMMSFARGPNYALYYEPLGDVNKDGVPDMVQHELFAERDFRHVTSVVSGKDGKVLWNLTMPRDVRTLEIGDADGDGAPDVLFVDWFSHEAGGRKADDYDTPGALPLVLRSGATGKTIWRATTYSAPADAVWQFIAMQKNGLLDVNGDGIMDVPLDSPEYLGDQSVIHHVTIASGKDAAPLQTFSAVGAFGVVASLGGDVTGDGKSDYALLSGDANDLWLTLHDGATAAPVWSHRALQLATSSYTDALPKMTLHALRQANGTMGTVVMDLHVQVRTWGFFDLFDAAGFSISTSSGAIVTTTPQLLAFDAADGHALWGLPDPANGPAVLGSTPGSKMYDMVLDRANHQAIAAVADAAPVVLPGAAAFAAAFPITFGAGVALVRFARRFEGVPDLV